MSAGGHVALRALAGIGEDDDAGLVLVGGGKDRVEVGVKAPAMMSTAARNLSSAMNICSAVCACATMRISSSTAAPWRCRREISPDCRPE